MFQFDENHKEKDLYNAREKKYVQFIDLRQ